MHVLSFSNCFVLVARYYPSRNTKEKLADLLGIPLITKSSVKRYFLWIFHCNFWQYFFVILVETWSRKPLTGRLSHG